MSALNSDLIDSLLEDLSDLATPTRGVEGCEEAYRRLAPPDRRWRIRPDPHVHWRLKTSTKSAT